MRIRLKWLLALLGITIFLFSGLSVYAGYGGGIGSGEGSGTGGKVDPNASSTGFSKNRTGYLFYIADSAGNVKTPVAFVPYNQMPSRDTETSLVEARVSNSKISSNYPEGIGAVTSGGFTKPPCTADGGSSGAELKNYLLGDSDGNGNMDAYDVMWRLWKNEDLLSEFKENGYYLCVEGVVWTGLTSGGRLYAYTSQSGAELYQAHGYTYLSRLIKQRLPKCMFMTQSWAGVCSASDMGGIPSGDIDLATLARRDSGFGMIAVMADATKEPLPIEPVSEASDDYLRANELNYYFPDFLKNGGDDGRSSQHYSNAFSMDMGDRSVWNIHTSFPFHNSKLKNGKWIVSESISSDIVNFYGKGNCLFYRASAGQWKLPSEPKEFTQSTGRVFPGYGFMYSRAVFGDNVLVSDFRGNGKAYEGYITEMLKLPLGHNGGNTVLNGVSGSEQKLGANKVATYTFKGQVTETYKEDHEDRYIHPIDGLLYVNNWTTDEESTYYSSDINYTLSHGLYKYTPTEKEIAKALSAGTTLYKGGSINRAWTRVIFGSQLPATLSIYPEVKYGMYYLGGKEAWGTPSRLDVYCMGDKVREAKPAVLHGYIVYYSSGKGSQGTSIVTSAMTGTRAFEYVDNFGDTSQEYMQLAVQGSGFSVATTNNPLVVSTSFALDLYNGDINGFNPKSEWQSGDLISSHYEFTNALKDNLTTEVHMKRFTDRSAHSQIGGTDEMSYDISDTRMSSVMTSQIRLVIKNGQITEGKSAVINKIASSYGITGSHAESVWNSWGIESQINNMLESSSDADNGSGGVKGSPSKWYDEESTCLAITVCESSICIGNIMFNDKTDYGSSVNQSTTDLSDVGTKGCQARFYFSLGFKNNVLHADGQSFDLSDKMYLIDMDEIAGSRFLISDATSHDWLR